MLNVKKEEFVVKKLVGIFLLMIYIVVLTMGCGNQNDLTKKENTTPAMENSQISINQKETTVPSEIKASNEENLNYNYINNSGKTLKTRINTPEGFTRTVCSANSFGRFIREYPLKKDGSPVLLYNGEEKQNQRSHIAVFDMNISSNDLQQCADSVIRMYAEYFYTNKKFDNIKFHFVNGFLCYYTKWRDGYRIQVNGNDVSWIKTSAYSDSYETFESYLNTVFCYASTLSLGEESEGIEAQEMQIGDVFLNPGSPGHVVMVVDMCENQNGEKAFLLAQGYMPAQEFHILKNKATDNDPWYYISDMNYPFNTPEYSFKEGSLKRLNYEE